MARLELLASTLVALNGAAAIADERGIDSALRVDTPLNQYTSTLQRTPSIGLGDGNMVVAWASRRQEAKTYGVFARLTDEHGRPIGDEVHVNEYMARSQMEPAVGVSGEHAWIAWMSEGQDGDQGALIARRFRVSEDGLTPVGGEIGVNVERLGHQGLASVACLADGRALITWTSNREDLRTAGRLFNADGTPASGEIVFADGPSMQATVETKSDGFLVAWTGLAENGVPAGIFARVVERDGTMGEVINVASGELQTIEPSVAADGAGNFVVGWLETDAGPMSTYGVYAKRFDAKGEPKGETIEISPAGDLWQSGAAVAMSDDGRFCVSYSVDTGEAIPAELRPKAPSQILAKFFDGEGNDLGEAVRVHKIAQGHQGSEPMPARRAVWGPREFPAFCWHGQTGRDGTGVAVSAMVAPGTEVAELAETPGEGRFFDREAMEVAAMIPPVFDEDWVRPPPDNDVRPAGDFGFQAWNGTGFTPPDPDLSVGPNTIVGVVNVAGKIFDKQGNLLFSQNLQPFFSSVGASGFLFDPVAVFDRLANRHILCVVEHTSNQTSWINLAVSKTADPQNGGDWWKYRFNTTNPTGGRFIDYQNLGVDAEGIYVTADYFSGDGDNRIHIFDKAPMLNGQATTMEIISTSSGFRSLGAVNHIDGDAPAPYFATSFGNSNSQITIDAVRNPLTNPQLVSRTISVPGYTQPPGAAQQGSSNRISTVDQRIKNGVYRNGSLWLAHNIGIDSVARVRFYEVAMRGWPESGDNPRLVQSGEVDLGPGVYTFFGDPGVDDDNNLVLQFNRSSSSEFVSIQRTYRLAGDEPGTVQEPVEVQFSTSPDNSGRWGDYSGMEEDPAAPGVFWGHDEYTRSGWRTWIGQIDLGSVVPSVEFVFPDGLPETFDPDGQTVRVEVVATDNGAPEPGTGRLFADPEQDGTFVEIAMEEVSPNVYDAELPATACLDTLDYYFAVDSTVGEMVTSPSRAPDDLHASLALEEMIVALSDDFETDQGWVAENLGAVRGDWERGVPIDDPSWPFDPSTDGDGSGSCYVTQNTAGASDIDGGSVRLTSPIFDMSGDLEFTIEYHYYLRTTRNDGTDGILVEVSDNDLAGPWRQIVDHDTDGGTAWRTHVISQGELESRGVNPGDRMRIRFTARDVGQDANVEAGVDGFMVTALSCDDSGGCVADIDGDGDADAEDFFAYLDLFASGDARADLDGDGDQDADDFFLYLDAFSSGC